LARLKQTGPVIQAKTKAAGPFDDSANFWRIWPGGGGCRINQTMNDSELLIQYTRGSDKAFAELVRRHLDLVFAAALRQVGGDRHRAEDVVQQVFIDLARKAPTLTTHPTLVGWLHASTRYTALNSLRREQRRARREEQSDIMNITSAGNEARWEQIRPVIDEALHELDEDDRQSVLLRFFGQQPFAAIAAQLGISENAAQKRVDRALDRLHAALKRRGISSTAVALAVALAESGVAAPATLAGTVTTAALAGAAGGGAGTLMVAGWLKFAAGLAALGVIGWAGLKWSEPSVTEHVPVSPTAAADARKPESIQPAPIPVPTPEPPKAVEPNPVPENKPMEQAVRPPAPAPKLYVVRPADTLKRIAAKVGVSEEALRLENPGYDFPRMRVGQQVRLPANATLPPPVPIPADQLYLVQPGDTLAIIAQKKALLVDELMLLNPDTDWQKLQIGQQIRAP